MQPGREHAKAWEEMEVFSLEKESDKETTTLKHVEILMQRETAPYGHRGETLDQWVEFR